MTEDGAASSPWAGGDGPEPVQPWRPNAPPHGATVNRALVEFGGSDQWVLLRIWHDSPGVEGAWGPFPSQDAANDVKDLLVAGGVEYSNWAVVPLNSVVIAPMVTVKIEEDTLSDTTPREASP